jgi:hypothetical protein
MKRILFFVFSLACLMGFTRPDVPGRKVAALNREKFERSFLKTRLPFKTSNVVYAWDTLILSDTVGMAEKRTRVLDNRGRILSEIDYLMDSAGWANSQRFTYTYDDPGHKSGLEAESWINGAWELSRRRSDSLNSSGLELESVYQRLTSGVWQNTTKFYSSYDASGHAILQGIANWHDNTWIDEERWIYTFDDHGNPVSESDEWWEDGTWKTLGILNYTLDESGRVLQSDWYRPKDGVLVPINRSTKSYHAGVQLSSELFEQWDSLSQSWVKQSRDTYDYDMRGNLITRLMEVWDTTNSVFVNENRARYEYDAQGNSTDGINEQWKTGSWQPALKWLDLYSQKELLYTIWMRYYKYHATYKSLSSGVGQVDINPELSVYPNPASDRLILDYKGINPPPEVVVYDLTGRPVLQVSLKGAAEIDVSRLAAGTYLLRMGSGSAAVSRVFIKE